MTTQNGDNGRATKGDLQALQYDVIRAIQSTKDDIVKEITALKVDFATTRTRVDRNVIDIERADKERDEIKKDVSDLKSSERKMTVVATFISSIIAGAVSFFRGQ